VSRRPRTLVVASGNLGKVREITRLLAGLDVAVLSLADFPEVPEVPEPHDTFAANAVAKAVAVARATQGLALADDSGLCVDVLDGAPGVLSARVAKDDAGRIAWLLDKLRDTPTAQRTARFVCVVAVATPVGAVRTWEGRVEGLIAEAPRGEGGFGYDPVFLVPDLGRTFAELAADEKNAISHRGKALRLAWEALRQDIPTRSHPSP
jgi:XTP/dITP diphosphohydrolase